MLPKFRLMWNLLTRIFLSATKTLGAETTPIVMSLVASLRSSVASLFAVSSEYCGLKRVSLLSFVVLKR